MAFLLKLVFHPVFAIGAHLFLSLGPQHVRELIDASPMSTGTLLIILRYIAGFGIAREANRLLNSWALNNWFVQGHKGWEHWDQEIAVVTGGCSGIGKAIVLGLAEKGVKVAILDVQDVPADLKEVGAITYRKCDITSSSAIHEAAESIRKDLGHPSILINNAGIATPGSILKITETQLNMITNVNLTSHWLTVKEFLPNMLENNKGHILSMASMGSYMAFPGTVAYSATKAGALAFHEGLSGEIRHFHKAPGVLTTMVHPTWVRTPMTDHAREAIEKSQGPMMTPEYVAERTLNQLFSCRGGHIFLPDHVWIGTALRAFPSWLHIALRDIASPKKSA